MQHSNGSNTNAPSGASGGVGASSSNTTTNNNGAPTNANNNNNNPTQTSPPTQQTTTSGSSSNQPQQQQESDKSRPLNVKDALNYLDQVKTAFADQPEVYMRFLDIMKDFKTRNIDTPSVITSVSTIFRDQKHLIAGFNMFLPPGYKIEADVNLPPVKLEPPTTATAPTGGGRIYPPPPPPQSQQSQPQSTTIATHPPPQPPVVVAQHRPQPPPPPQQQQQKQQQGIPGHGQHPPSAPPHGPPPGGPHHHPYTPAAPNPQHMMPMQHGPPPGHHHPVPYDPAGHPQQPPPPPPGAGARPKHNLEFNHAINYVNKIKNRFANDNETYKQFLEILQTYKQSKPIHEVYAQVQQLFKNAPDLLDEFKQFLPDISNRSQQQGNVFSLMNNNPNNSQGGSNQSPSAFARSSFPKRGAQQPSPGFSGTGSQPSSQPVKKKPKTSTTTVQKDSNTMEELEFFEKVKKAINYKPTYNEFLKVLNLFSQEIIDARTLVERVTPFLERTPELFDWFKKFVKYEEDDVVFNTPLPRPELEVGKYKRSGSSYRLLPKEYPRGTCSGRDKHSQSVLNDDWISHPLFTSEGNFVTQRKNVHEEALFKAEEERYEFDRCIEANLHIISLLEPLAFKILELDDRSSFKLSDEHQIGGSICRRVVKKIYDRERGTEVYEALLSNPGVAIPVVLKRLKQKDEEWKKSQREWNKIWREVEGRNFVKSLDYQAPNFKVNDLKKVLVPKNLCWEIERIYAEQKENTQASTTTTSSRKQYQLDFKFSDPELFLHVRHLVMKALEPQDSSSDTDEEVKACSAFLRKFVGQFLNCPSEEFGSDEIVELESQQQDDGNFSEMSVDGASDTDDENSASAAARKKKSGQLRRSLIVKQLKADKNLVAEQQQKDQNAGKPANNTRSTFSLYANTSIYILFRYIQTMYSRLLVFKELSKQLAENPPKIGEFNPVAVDLGLLQQKPELAFNESDRFSDFMVNLYELTCRNMDSVEFEERTRAMYSTSAYTSFTLDKVAGLIGKQVQSILNSNDDTTRKVLDLFYKERNETSTSVRQEAAYRIAVENLVDGGELFRCEYMISEKVVTIGYLPKDMDKMAATSEEEKWGAYVDSFVQLGRPSNDPKGTYLKRNLPSDNTNNSSETSQAPRNIVTKSGLELKICVNTYKIFFVDGTEDYFYRKRPSAATSGDIPKKTLLESVKRGVLDKWKEGTSDDGVGLLNAYKSFVGNNGSSFTGDGEATGVAAVLHDGVGSEEGQGNASSSSSSSIAKETTAIATTTTSNENDRMVEK